jgi:hypothetical protein
MVERRLGEGKWLKEGEYMKSDNNEGERLSRIGRWQEQAKGG